MLETDPHYHFYELDASEFGEFTDDYAPVSIVDNQAMLVVTSKLVLNFTQPDIIRTLYEHLYNTSRKKAKYSKGREKTIARIRDLLALLTN
jgi:hypothetical protein